MPAKCQSWKQFSFFFPVFYLGYSVKQNREQQCRTGHVNDYKLGELKYLNHTYNLLSYVLVQDTSNKMKCYYHDTKLLDIHLKLKLFSALSLVSKSACDISYPRIRFLAGQRFLNMEAAIQLISYMRLGDQNCSEDYHNRH